MKPKRLYQVIVYGTVWLKTGDELLAHAYANHTRSCGWKDVKVV